MLQDIPFFKTARVNLLHVVSEQSKSVADDHRSRAEDLLQSSIQRMGLISSNAKTLVREGDTKQTVLKVADELDADLIVMGTRGINLEQASSSTAARVIQLAPCPVLVVP